MKKILSFLSVFTFTLIAPALNAQVSTGDGQENHIIMARDSVAAPAPAPRLASDGRGVLVDRVIAVVGGQIVKESDVENAVQQYVSSGIPVTDSVRGEIVEQLMFKKLLIQQAEHDSIVVGESEIASETDRRMRYFLMQFRSTKEFEQFYGKTVDAFKFELHDQVKELLLAQRMQGKITQNVGVSPSDVTAWYNAQPADSLPFINSEVEVGQIVIVPPLNLEIKEYIRQSLEETRQKVLTNKMSFCDAALLVSEDPGSKTNCGKYENVRRGTFVPEFDAICFNLKEGEISQVFETEYGFHFVRLIARMGEEVTIQHVLKSIPSAPEDLKRSKIRLDSIINLIRIDSLTFCEAAAKYSDDAETKFSCGLFVNPETGTTRINVDLLGQMDADPQFPIIINNMKVGEMSAPQPCLTRNGKQGYRVLYLRHRSQPHRANLTDDYQLIQDLAMSEKQSDAIDAWVNRRLANTYIRIAEDYKKYKFKYPWLAKKG
jgi:peptidyl-prolyl cis-trans isomerase SurA